MTDGRRNPAPAPEPEERPPEPPRLMRGPWFWLLMLAFATALMWSGTVGPGERETLSYSAFKR